MREPWAYWWSPSSSSLICYLRIIYPHLTFLSSWSLTLSQPTREILHQIIREVELKRLVFTLLR